MPDNLNLNLDQNLNLNLNLGATGAGGGGFGPRFNTEDFCRLSPLPVPRPEALPTLYSAEWDPEYRAWEYVSEFVSQGEGLAVAGFRGFDLWGIAVRMELTEET